MAWVFATGAFRWTSFHWFRMNLNLFYFFPIRDIKPQNLLVNPTTFTLKLCDFGSAKNLVPGEPNVAYICSRWGDCNPSTVIVAHFRIPWVPFLARSRCQLLQMLGPLPTQPSYYRAPELIFGSTEYTTAIDVWSAGCVMAEMLIGTPLFPGSSGVDQLVEIIKVFCTLHGTALCLNTGCTV